MFSLALGRGVALPVAAVSSYVLLFGVYEAQSGFVRRCCRWPAWGINDAHSRVRLCPVPSLLVFVHSGLSVAAVPSYVLLFGVYEALESGPLDSQLRACSPVTSFICVTG